MHSNNGDTSTLQRMNRRQFGRTLCEATATGTIAAAASGLVVPAYGQGAATPQTGAEEFPRPATLRRARSSIRASPSASPPPSRRAFGSSRNTSPRSASAISRASRARCISRSRSTRTSSRSSSTSAADLIANSAAVPQRHRERQDADHARLVRSAREHERPPVLPGRRRVLAVVHALHAGRAQAARSATASTP